MSVFKSWKEGRDSRTGRFISRRQALLQPFTTTVDTLKRVVGKAKRK